MRASWMLGRDGIKGFRRGIARALTWSMSILWMLIIGLVVGAIAKLLIPGKDPGGVLITMAIGVAGSLLAGLVGSALGFYAAASEAGLLASILGAVVLLLIYRAVVGKPRGRRRL